MNVNIHCFQSPRMLTFSLTLALKDMNISLPLTSGESRVQNENTEEAVESVGAVLHGPPTRASDT